MGLLKRIFKLLFTAILIIAIFLGGVIGSGFLGKYFENKEKNKERIRDEIQTSITETKEKINNSKNNTLFDKILNKFGIETQPTNNDSEGSSSSGSLQIGEYTPSYFDDAILLFGGNRNGTEVKELIDRVIENTNQTLFSYVSVSFKDAGNTIVFNDKDAYISELRELYSTISDSANYNISFGYNNLKTHVTEIIIENSK